MSFSTDLKNEILDGKPLRARLKKARAYGLLAFSRNFSGEAVELATENPGVARLFGEYLRDFLGHGAQIAPGEKSRNGRTVYLVRLGDRDDREKLTGLFGHNGNTINMEFLPTPAHVQAFLSGAYLACGNTTDPQKSYHAEFVTRSESLCGSLKALLDSCLPGAKSTRRRGSFVVYYKEYAQIEDLLTMMGASRSTLSMIEIEMIKSVRNSANRATNCETANIDKLVNAATSRIEDIRLVLDSVGGEALPESLRAAALLRLENPDASLRELAEMSEPPVSRSGMYHRLENLSKIAGELRARAGEKK